MIVLAARRRLWHDIAMSKRTPMAGGFFLILPIVAGFAWGLATGRAMQGALVGLAIGVVLALIVWALDRRQG